jgi:hemerythrin-like domain-containing protein
MSTTQTTPRPHVRQYLLPRQSAAPAGAVDVKMMYVAHHAFRRDLVLFADAAAATPAGDRETWTAIAARWAVFSEVLHHHHSGEDAGLWPRLLEVAAPDERRTLEDMEAEHSVIDPILKACAALLERVCSTGDPAAAAELADRFAEARDSLFAHLVHEESEAMVLVQKYLTTEDWEELEKTHFHTKQSFAFLAAVVPWIVHELPEDIRQVLFAEAGAPMRMLWRFTHRRFERLDARARTHLS